MSKLTVNRSKSKNISKEELLLLDKEELVNRIIQLETHNNQLKCIIAKRNGNEIDAQISNIDNAVSSKKREFDFTKHNSRRILLRIAYFGKNYRGLAVQEDCADTIENHLFYALQKARLISSRETSGYHRCGRTDKGVTASGQVISLTVRSQLSKEDLATCENLSNEISYCKILNRLLPNDIRAISWIPIDLKENGEPFSARFDCKQRTYKYWFPKLLFDIETMRKACKYLEGSHDFRNLCKMDVANGVVAYVRHVHSAEIYPEKVENTDNEYDMYYLQIVSNAFLWHQIRCIVGVLFLIGIGAEEPSIIQQLLDVEKCPRKPQYNMAIDLPLNLFHCKYDIIKDDEVPNDNEVNTKKTSWFVDSEDLVMVIKCFREQWTKAAIEASMIKDVISDLKNLYDTECKRMIENGKGISSGKAEEVRNKIFSPDDLNHGIKSKKYIPLMKRPMCEPLESRIQHYVKKKRLNETMEMEIP